MSVHSAGALAAQLRALGLDAGRTALVHAAMRPVGPVHAPGSSARPARALAGHGPPGCLPNGSPYRGSTAADPAAETVLAALTDVLGPYGTLVVPAFTESNSATSRLHRDRTARMTAAEAARYRAAMPPFDPGQTPSENVGRLAEAVRRAPGARRSRHPQTSFAALGARAPEVVARHDEDDHLGEESPLRWLYDNDAAIVLIGVGYSVCSAFHLAEYRIQDPPRRDYSCVVRRDGGPQWITYEDVELDDSDFGALGGAFESRDEAMTTHDDDRRIRRGRVGDAESRCLSLRDAVDFAVGWLSENRPRVRRAVPGA